MSTLVFLAFFVCIVHNLYKIGSWVFGQSSLVFRQEANFLRFWVLLSSIISFSEIGNLLENWTKFCLVGGLFSTMMTFWQNYFKLNVSQVYRRFSPIFQFGIGILSFLLFAKLSQNFGCFNENLLFQTEAYPCSLPNELFRAGNDENFKSVYYPEFFKFVAKKAANFFLLLRIFAVCFQRHLLFCKSNQPFSYGQGINQYKTSKIVIF